MAELLIQQLGGSSRFVREQRQAARRLVSEIYSPPRITKEIVEGKWKHVAPGFALDLTVNDPLDGLPWDFSRASKRNRARAFLREQKPLLLIGSPECKAFSTWMVLNRARARCVEAIDKALARAKKHLEFVASLYEEQLEGGRYFLHEHPLYASSQP